MSDLRCQYGVCGIFYFDEKGAVSEESGLVLKAKRKESNQLYFLFKLTPLKEKNQSQSYKRYFWFFFCQPKEIAIF